MNWKKLVATAFVASAVTLGGVACSDENSDQATPVNTEGASDPAAEKEVVSTLQDIDANVLKKGATFIDGGQGWVDFMPHMSPRCQKANPDPTLIGFEIGQAFGAGEDNEGTTTYPGKFTFSAKVDGDKAEVTANYPGSPARTSPWVKTDGKWQLDNCN